MRKISILITMALLAYAAAPVAAATFELDRAHSSVSFKVKHLAISKVKGHFDEFDARFEFTQGEPETWKAEATIQAASVNTGNEQRDTHLKSSDFLEVESYPTIDFVSTGVTVGDDGATTLHGDLTIHGVTRPVDMALEVRGMADFMGTTKAGFEAVGTINRKDFGLTWHKAIETGGLVVGDEVEIVIEIEGNMMSEVASEEY